MGYYTGYSITVRKTNGNTFSKEEVERLSLCMSSEDLTDDEIDEYDIPDGFSGKRIIGYAVDEAVFLDSDRELVFSVIDTVKWYEYEEDMIELSKVFPDCVFCVSGYGEEVDDQWQHYFQCGKSEYCCSHRFYDQPTRIKWPGGYDSNGTAK